MIFMIHMIWIFYYTPWWMLVAGYPIPDKQNFHSPCFVTQPAWREAGSSEAGICNAFQSATSNSQQRLPPTLAAACLPAVPNVREAGSLTNGLKLSLTSRLPSLPAAGKLLPPLMVFHQRPLL
jgi:hypothetical protein